MTRKTKVYYNTIMNSKAVQNLEQSPSREELPDRGAHHSNPFPVCARCIGMCKCVSLGSHAHVCMCGCLCMFMCVCVTCGCWVGSIRVACPLESHFPRRGPCQSVLFLLNSLFWNCPGSCHRGGGAAGSGSGQLQGPCCVCPPSATGRIRHFSFHFYVCLYSLCDSGFCFSTFLMRMLGWGLVLLFSFFYSYPSFSMT